MSSRPIEHCYWVVPGKLLAGEYPRNIDEESSRSKLSRLTEAGISAFIDLTQEGEMFTYAQWLGTETHQRFPVVDSSVPESPGLTSAVLDAIDEHIDQGRMVYFHCIWGIGRTGTIIGCWLARHGHTGAGALARLDELWRHCPESMHWDSPETLEQERYVLDWEEGPLITIGDRYRGCLMGLAAGDAVGTTVEFEPPRNVHPGSPAWKVAGPSVWNRGNGRMTPR